jgi:hypothetical protein
MNLLSSPSFGSETPHLFRNLTDGSCSNSLSCSKSASYVLNIFWDSHAIWASENLNFEMFSNELNVQKTLGSHSRRIALNTSYVYGFYSLILEKSRIICFLSSNKSFWKFNTKGVSPASSIFYFCSFSIYFCTRFFWKSSSLNALSAVSICCFEFVAPLI